LKIVKFLLFFEKYFFNVMKMMIHLQEIKFDKIDKANLQTINCKVV